MEKVFAGDDVEIEVQLFDYDNVIIDLDELLGLTVEVCESSCHGIKVLNYNVTPTGDEKQITITDAPNGLFTFVLPRTWTVDNVGRMFNFEITAIMDRTGDPDFEDDEQHVSTILYKFIKIEAQC